MNLCKLNIVFQPLCDTDNKSETELEFVSF